MDPKLNSLLAWSTANSTSASNPNDPSAPTGELPSNTPRALDPELMSALLGGPSDADLMKESMSAILSSDPEISLDDKMVAFDNLEQLIENLDNANLLAPLGLWTPLLSCLEREEDDMKMMASWCVGTAVQNNEKSQERLLAMGGLPMLVKLAVGEGESEKVRRKAVYALSSGVRNYQPGMDVLTEELGKVGRSTEKIDASDMEACDGLIGGLREDVKNGRKVEG